MSQNSEPKNNTPKPVNIGQVRIDIFNDGSIQVTNFPSNFVQAMSVMAEATKAVAAFFVRGAAENRFDANGRDKHSKIVVVPGGAIKPN